MEVLIQGEPEMLELPGDSYYFVGRHNGHDRDPLGEGEHCTVANEYIDEYEEADVDTIVIDQEEEYEEEDEYEEADYEGDIEIHEESLEV